MNANEHPFYRPLWRRVAIVAFTGGSALFEAVYSRDPLWASAWAAAFAYALWNFIIKYPKQPEDQQPEE